MTTDVGGRAMDVPWRSLVVTSAGRRRQLPIGHTSVRIACASRRLYQLPIVVVTMVAVVAIDAGAGSAASAQVRTSDACKTFVLGRGGFGTLQHCRSFGTRDIPRGSEKNGSGQFEIGLGA